MGVIAGPRPESSDRDLVGAVRAGDDSAFEELFRRYSRRVAGYVYRMMGDHDRAEDVTQEAFVSALRRLRQTDSEIAFKPWIFEIAKNAAIDQFRRTSRAEEVSLHAEDGSLRPADLVRLVGREQPPDVALVGKERLDHLRGAFDELSESHLRILVLREFEGLSYREIGERMELTRPAVESTLFRARRRLNQEYAELEGGARCVAMTAAMTRIVDGSETARDQRRLERHVRRCIGCRRHARRLGVELEPRSSVAGVAGLLPLPLLRRRGGGGDSAAYASGAQHAGNWAPAFAASDPLGWGKAVAIVATIVIAGGGAAVNRGAVTGERADEATRAKASERARPDARQHGAGPALGVSASPRATGERSAKGGGVGPPAGSAPPPARADERSGGGGNLIDPPNLDGRIPGAPAVGGDPPEIDGPGESGALPDTSMMPGELQRGVPRVEVSPPPVAATPVPAEPPAAPDVPGVGSLVGG